MSSATPMFEVGAVVLGYVGLTASWRRYTATTAQTSSSRQPMLIVSSAASTDDGAHEPAQSVTINSVEGLLALRAAIDAALGTGGAA